MQYVRSMYATDYEKLRIDYEFIRSFATTRISSNEMTVTDAIASLNNHAFDKVDDMTTSLRTTRQLVDDSVEKLSILLRKYESDTEDDRLSMKSTVALLKSLLVWFARRLGDVIDRLKITLIEYDEYDNFKDLTRLSLSNVNDTDELGNSVLLYAVANRCNGYDIVERLLKEFDADPFVKSRFNETPFSKALARDDLYIAKEFLRREISSSTNDDYVDNELLALVNERNVGRFYRELARNLFDDRFASKLRLDEDCRRVCFVHVKENYESLGLDSDVLYFEDGCTAL